MADLFNQKGAAPAPYSQEAEEAVLGAIITNPLMLPDVALFLKADDFFLLRCRYIWQAMMRLSERNEPVEYVTLAKELGDMGKLDEIGGPAHLTHLINAAPSTQHATFYGRIVERTATRRRLMAAADQIKALAMDEALDTLDVCIHAQQLVDEAHPSRLDNVVPAGTSIHAYHEVQKGIAEAVRSGQMVAYPLPASWVTLTEYIPAMYPGDFVVISGQEGGGKSSALEQLAEHFAQTGLWTSYMHTEQSTEQILHRRMARHAGIAYSLLASGGFAGQPGGFTSAQKQMMDGADAQIAKFEKRLSYHWMADVQFGRLQNQMKREAAAGVKVFLIDHFQDIQFAGAGGREQNIVRAYEQACVWLAAFAETRKVLVIVASQENKEGRAMWTRKLHQKATLLISIKRKELESDYSYWQDGIEYRAHAGESSPKCEWWIAKARFGKRGKVRMINHGARFAWLDMSEVQTQPPAARRTPMPTYEARSEVRQ